MAALTIFFGAFFAFFVQPLIGNSLLPLFGGTATVWSICLAAFQILLVGGYFYAHVMESGGMIRRGRLLGHVLLLVLAAGSIFFFRGNVLGCVSAAAGAYLLLSANSSLVQVLSGGRYELYAVSNLGSLLGLLCYPFLLEPSLSLSANWMLFGGGVAAYALSFAILLLRHPSDGVSAGRTEGSNETNRYAPLQYFLLSALSCYLLNAVSAHLCMDVSPLPMFWSVILSTYLVSFIFAFTDRSVRFVFPALGGFIFLALGWVVWWPEVKASGGAVFVPELIFGLLILLFGGFIVHSRLYRARPGWEHLTGYYLMIALGGAAGGAVASFLMPCVSNSVVEYPIAITLVLCVVATEPAWRSLVPWLNRQGLVVPEGRKGLFRLSVPVLLVVLAVVGICKIDRAQGTVLCRFRNLYGLGYVSFLTPEDLGDKAGEFHANEFVSAGTVHGYQKVNGEWKGQMPTAYYAEHCGGAAILKHPKYAARQPMRVALCGMGIGTLATYATRRDFYRFYEINPAVVRIATDTNLFSFVSGAAGDVSIVVNDARRALEGEWAAGEEKYDVLVVDVFSGDSIPAHMATREAFELYLNRIEPDGILAFHLSNWHLNLLPMVKAAAREFHLNLEMVFCQKTKLAFDSTWAFLSPVGLPKLRDCELQTRIAPEDVADMKLMTDDFHSLLPYVRLFR